MQASNSLQYTPTKITTDFETELQTSQAEQSSDKVKIAVMIALAALAVLAVALTIACWVIVPLAASVAIAAIVSATLVGGAASVGAVLYTKYLLPDSQKQINRAFEHLLTSDDGRYSDEKLALMQRYGKYCTELNICYPTSPFHALGPVINLGTFFDWYLRGDRKDAITVPEVRTFIESLNKEENKNKLQSFGQLVKLSSLMDYLELCSNQPKAYDELKQEISDEVAKMVQGVVIERENDQTKAPKSYPEKGCWTAKKMADVIRACPNLESIDLNGYLAFDEVQKACKEVDITPKIDNKGLASTMWSRSFPEMVL